MSRPFPIRRRLGVVGSHSRGPTAPFSSRALFIFLPSSVPVTRPHSVGERLSVFALAVFFLVSLVGVAFAAGYLIGRMLL